MRFQRCLSVLHLVDDGRTIVMQAGRSDPQFKGSGSFQYMRHHGRNRFAVPRWTDVRRTRSASVHTAYWENRTDTNVLITRVSYKDARGHRRTRARTHAHIHFGAIHDDHHLQVSFRPYSLMEGTQAGVSKYLPPALIDNNVPSRLNPTEYFDL